MLDNMASNSKLLTAKGSPLKIYLDGFDIANFLEISSLIDTYGGELANADHSNVVLSAPSHPPGTKYRRFHINWLYDSINSCKLQDIAKYILSPRSHQDDSVLLQEDSDAEEPKIKALEWRKEDTENNSPNMSTTSSDTPTRKRTKSTEDESENQEPNDNDREHSAKKLKTRNSSRMRTRLSTEGATEKRQSSSGRRVVKSPSKKWSSEEDQKIIQFFMEKKDTAIQIPNLCRQMEATMNFLQPFRSADALRHRIIKHIIPNLQQLTDDPKVVKAFEEIGRKRRSTTSSN